MKAIAVPPDRRYAKNILDSKAVRGERAIPKLKDQLVDAVERLFGQNGVNALVGAYEAHPKDAKEVMGLFEAFCKISEDRRTGKIGQLASKSMIRSVEKLLVAGVTPNQIEEFVKTVEYSVGLARDNDTRMANAVGVLLCTHADRLLANAVDEAHIVNHVRLAVEQLPAKFEEAREKLMRKGGYVLDEFDKVLNGAQILCLETSLKVLGDDKNVDLEPWAMNGVKYSEQYMRNNDKGGILRYYSADSEYSVDEIVRIVKTRTVTFSEMRGVLDRLADIDSMAGVDIKVDTYEHLPPELHVPHTDCKSKIYFQPNVDEFPTREQNERVYMVTEAHESGHIREQSHEINIDAIDLGPLKLSKEEIDNIKAGEEGKNGKEDGKKGEGVKESSEMSLRRKMKSIMAEGIFRGLKEGKPAELEIEFDSYTDLMLKLFKENAQFASYLHNIIEDGRVDFLNLLKFPNLRADYEAATESALMKRPPVKGTDIQSIMEALLQLTVCHKTRDPLPPELEKIVWPLYKDAMTVQREGATATDSFNVMVRIYSKLKELLKNQPKPKLNKNFSHRGKNPTTSINFSSGEGEGEKEQKQKGKGKGKPGEQKKEGGEQGGQQKKGEQGDKKKEGEGGSGNEKGKKKKEGDGKGEDTSGGKKGKREGESGEEEQADGKKEGEAGPGKGKSEGGNSGKGKVKLKYTGKPPAETPEERAEREREQGDREYKVKQWNYSKRTFEADGARLIERKLPGSVRDDLTEEREIIEKVKRVLEKLKRPTITTEKRLETGEDIDIDALIDFAVDWQMDVFGEMDFYEKTEYTPQRDVAVAVLLDASGSTEGYVIEVEKKASRVLAVACDDLGDKFAIYTYRQAGGYRSGDAYIEFGVGKGFEDPPRDFTVHADGGTPTAAAIRHATNKLAEVDAKVKILIVLTDGQPNVVTHVPGNVNQYEYVYRDVNAAFREAFSKGVKPWSINIGRGWDDEILGMMYDNWHSEIDSIDQLPGKMYELYVTNLGKV